MNYTSLISRTLVTALLVSAFFLFPQTVLSQQTFDVEDRDGNKSTATLLYDNPEYMPKWQFTLYRVAGLYLGKKTELSFGARFQLNPAVNTHIDASFMMSYGFIQGSEAGILLVFLLACTRPS